MSDLIEDFFAYLCVTEPDGHHCAICNAELEESDDGELFCPNCDR